MTKKPILLSALLLALALLLAACGDSGDVAGAPDEEDTPAAAETTADDAATDDAATDDAAADDAATDDAATDDAAMGDGAMVAVASSDLGEILVDADGATLYLFDNDEGGESACYDDCAANWPALTTDGEPQAGEGADAALLGTTERTDGTTQVTYNGHPLYYFAGDSAAGDTNGQGVGEIWWVVSPAGEAIQGADAEAAIETGDGY